MVSETGLLWGIGLQWYQRRVLYACALAGVDPDGFVSFIGATHGDCLLASLVLFQWVEAIRK